MCGDTLKHKHQKCQFRVKVCLEFYYSLNIQVIIKISLKKFLRLSLRFLNALLASSKPAKNNIIRSVSAHRQPPFNRVN